MIRHEMSDFLISNSKKDNMSKQALKWVILCLTAGILACIVAAVWLMVDHEEKELNRHQKTQSQVVASLTTIPSRIETNCKEAIDSLLPQVSHVYLSVSEHYQRFGTFDKLPTYFEQEPYKSRVTVVWGPDHGPASKYLGCLSVIPSGTWIFVCDDDQRYHPKLIQKAFKNLDSNYTYQNRCQTIRNDPTASGGLIHGYVGLFVWRDNMNALPTFQLPPVARFIDDQWMSLYHFRRNIAIKSTGIEEYRDIYENLHEKGHELIGPDSLAALKTRSECVKELAELFQVHFLPHGIIKAR